MIVTYINPYSSQIRSPDIIPYHFIYYKQKESLIAENLASLKYPF